MSDLISRSEVLKILHDFGNRFEPFSEDAEAFAKMFIQIRDMDFYKIEKVVDELGKLKSNLGFGGTLQTMYADNKLDKAIEIVKQGGISYDVCEWTQSGDMAINPHTFSKYKIKQCDGLYALSTCPYCRKKIKVME